jgi:hypothetical protein
VPSFLVEKTKRKIYTVIVTCKTIEKRRTKNLKELKELQDEEKRIAGMT